MPVIKNVNETDNMFWLQLMGDYARFIFDALSPSEATEAARAQEFIKLMDSLLARARMSQTDGELQELNKDAYAAMQDFRKYILYLARLQLTGHLVFSLRRTGVNEYPALTSLNSDTAMVMIKYAQFLVELINLMHEKKVLGNLTILYLDSMYRQLCYYITELSKVSSVQAPVCDPASPRMLTP